MGTELYAYAASATQEIAEKIDECLVRFFGSEELVKAYAHLYVLEQEPTIMESFMMPDLSGNNFKLRTETRIRIRPKTQAELEAEGLHV